MKTYSSEFVNDLKVKFATISDNASELLGTYGFGKVGKDLNRFIMANEGFGGNPDDALRVYKESLIAFKKAFVESFERDTSVLLECLDKEV